MMLGGAHLLVQGDLSLKPDLARPKRTLRLVLRAETSDWLDLVLRTFLMILCYWITFDLLLFPINRSQPAVFCSLLVPEVRVTKTLLL